MDIKEILERPSPALYQIEEMEFAVEQYIYQQKNKVVKVETLRDFPKNGLLNQYGIMMYQDAINKLFLAFETVQKNYKYAN